MGTPTLELQLIGEAFNDAITNIVNEIHAQVQEGRANGVPDATTVQRFKENLKSPTENVNGIVNALKRKTTTRLRQTYSTMQSELSASLANPKDIPHAIPKKLGYKFDAGDLGDEVVNLGDERIGKRLKELQKRAESELGRIDDEAEAELDDRVRRDRDGQRIMWLAALRGTCKDCLVLSGQIKTHLEWKLTGIRPGNGRTICKEHCQCHLVPVKTMLKRLEIDESDIGSEAALTKIYENGIKLQEKKIEFQESERKQKYAPSTFLAKMGEIRTKEFNPNFEKRESLFVRRKVSSPLSKPEKKRLSGLVRKPKTIKKPAKTKAKAEKATEKPETKEIDTIEELDTFFKETYTEKKLREPGFNISELNLTSKEQIKDRAEFEKRSIAEAKEKYDRIIGQMTTVEKEGKTIVVYRDKPSLAREKFDLWVEGDGLILLKKIAKEKGFVFGTLKNGNKVVIKK